MRPLSEVDQGMVYAFIHGHCKRLVELLESDREYHSHGAKLDGNGEMEVMGHLRTLSLYTNKLEEYFSDLCRASGGSK